VGDVLEDSMTTADQCFTRGVTHFVFDRDLEPAGTVKPGQTFVVETVDSLCGFVKSERDRFSSFDELLALVGGANPVTGPIYVEGCRSGDWLAVTVIDIVAAPRTGKGWTMLIPGWGGLTHEAYSIQESLPPQTLLAEVGPAEVTLDIDGHQVRIPAQPFIGTIGVAPTSERRVTLSQSAEYGGDLDIPALRPGSTLMMRARVDGGLLSLGDVHAAQGDAEITGVAIEIEADVRLRIDVIRADDAPYGRLPVLESPDRIGVIAAFGGVPLTACVRAGYAELCGYLQRSCGFSREGAYMLLGQVGRVQVGNMIDPFYSCLVEIEKKYLE
jgi:amidase